MRLIGLIRLMDTGRRLPMLSELALRFDCSERTIRRDVEALRAAGCDVELRRAA